jgi:Tfp pilus assembly pilus retraction ATPase PilT
MEATTETHKFEIFIIYNGVTKTLAVEPHQQLQAVLQHAIHLFGITQNQHLLSLFREDGTVVPEHQSVHDAGIKHGEHLALRPNVVKGG